MEKLKVLELFSGIGACSKALERLGIDFEIVDSVEIDKFAVKSFNAIHGTNFEPQDICTWDKDIEVDLIMHGSPCVDFSLAGKQAGGDKDSGTRSSLMYETIRIVEKLKPKYVVWENVKNLLSKKHRHNFDAYLEIMGNLGYTNYYQVLNAKDYGVPQHRERVFTISILNDKCFNFPKGVGCDSKIKMIDIPQKVSVRKYDVDVEKLKNELRSHKNMSNREIAEQLDKPITLVEHWFRKDDCFSIPDADIWFKLKDLLNIKTDEFDNAITVFEEKDNIYDKSNRFYYDTGLAPTITSSSANEKIIETFAFPPKQELKLKLKDILEDNVDEKYYLSDEQVNKIKYSKVTQDLKDPKCVEVNRKYGIFDTEKQTHQAGSVYDENGLAPTLDTMQGGWRQPCIEEKSFVQNKYEKFIEEKGYIPEMFNPYNEKEVKDVAPTQSTYCGSMTSSVTVLIKNNTKQGYLEASDVGCVVDKPRKDIKELDKYCKYCGNKLERKRFNGRLEDFKVFSNRQYCNRECMKKDYLKIGKHNQSYSNAHATARKINELILHKDVCEICGSKTNLDIHHIDGDWQNNSLDNLMCLCRSCHTKYEKNKNNNLRIRKLTPRETWRLMGFDDEDFEKATKVNSNTQLYKQAGNSICVPVLEAIFKNLLKDYLWSDLD